MEDGFDIDGDFQMEIGEQGDEGAMMEQEEQVRSLPRPCLIFLERSLLLQIYSFAFFLFPLGLLRSAGFVVSCDVSASPAFVPRAAVNSLDEIPKFQYHGVSLVFYHSIL